MFWLICATVNIENVLFWLECRDRDVCVIGQWHRQWRTISLQPTRQSDAASDHSHPVLWLVDSLLNNRNAPDFVVNWLPDHGCWLFGDHKSGVMNACFCAWPLFRHFRRRSHYRTGRDQTLSIPAEVCGRPSWPSLSFTAATLSSLCVHFGLALPCLQSVLACFSQLLLSFYFCRVLLCPALTLYPKIQPVPCMNHVL